MGVRLLLDFDLWCPYSGVKLGGKVVEPHKFKIMRVTNGTLYGICTLHRTRMFTADPTTVSQVMEVAPVLSVVDKVGRRNKPNGS